MSKKMMIASAVAMAVASLPAAAQTKPAEREKCFGIAKAGKNDCTGGGVASCAGKAAKDGQGFLALPKGVCEKIVGGSLTDPTKK